MKNNLNKNNNTPEERFSPLNLNLSFSPFFRHYLRYFTCLELVGKLGKNESWLDCASGSGYGTYFLSNFTSHVTGYDIDKETILLARKEYQKENLKFEFEDLKIQKSKFDVVFSIETIEHINEKDGQAFLKMLINSLKKEGKLIITTPIVEKTNRKPANPFHVIEYDRKDFKKILENLGLKIISEKFVETLFTDNELKNQGYFLCKLK